MRNWTVTGGTGILSNATHFSQHVSSFSALSFYKRKAYLLGTPTSSSALTSRHISCRRRHPHSQGIRWRSRLGSVRTRLSALPGQYAFLSVTLLPIRKVSGKGEDAYAPRMCSGAQATLIHPGLHSAQLHPKCADFQKSDFTPAPRPLIVNDSSCHERCFG